MYDHNNTTPNQTKTLFHFSVEGLLYNVLRLAFWNHSEQQVTQHLLHPLHSLAILLEHFHKHSLQVLPGLALHAADRQPASLSGRRLSLAHQRVLQVAHRTRRLQPGRARLQKDFQGAKRGRSTHENETGRPDGGWRAQLGRLLALCYLAANIQEDHLVVCSYLVGCIACWLLCEWGEQKTLSQ